MKFKEFTGFFMKLEVGKTGKNVVEPRLGIWKTVTNLPARKENSSVQLICLITAVMRRFQGLIAPLRENLPV